MGIDIPAGMQTEDEAKQEQNEIKEQQKLTTSAN